MKRFCIDDIFPFLLKRSVIILYFGSNFVPIPKPIIIACAVFNVLCLLNELFSHFYCHRFSAPPLDKHASVLITGGSSGLGAALIPFLLPKVGRVIVLDQKKPERTYMSSKIWYISVDLSNERDLDGVLDDILLTGRVTHIINNAGMRGPIGGLLNASTLECSAKMFATNVAAPLKIMERLVDKSRPTFIINIGSVLGKIAPANLGLYAATKAALMALHESLVHENNPNLYMLMIQAGQLNSKMFADVKPPRQFFAPVVDVQILAKQIVQWMEHGRTGTVGVPLYTGYIGILSVLPVWMSDILRKWSGVDATTINTQ